MFLELHNGLQTRCYSSLSLSVCLSLPLSSWVWVFVVKKKTRRMNHKPTATPAFESARKLGRITKTWHPNWEKNATQMFLELHNGLQTRCYSSLSLSLFASPFLFLGLSFCSEEEDPEDEPQTNGDASVWICQKARSNYKNLTPKLREKCDANVFRTAQRTPNTLLQLSFSLSASPSLFLSLFLLLIDLRPQRIESHSLKTP
jgi:hypothetical protein